MEITKLSSKGQIVIPEKIRKNIKKGTPFIVSTMNNKYIVLKKIEGISKEDMETLKGLQKAWDDLAAGKGIRLTKRNFLKELAKW